MREMFYKKCKEAGIRITPQRETIYSFLASEGGHPSADDVYREVKRKLSNVSFDTVHRTLSLFSDIGLIKTVEGHGRPKRFDPTTEEHHHFQCVKCGGITDFNSRELDRIKVPADIKKRFIVTGKKVVIEGICGACRE